MATLTVTAYHTRNIIKYGSIFIVFLIFARVIWMTGANIYTHFFPPPPPPPQVAFGKLPKLAFEEKTNATYTYALQTATGELPNLSPQGLVYFMPQSTSSLLALDEAVEIAHDLGFGGSGLAQSETIYRFGRDRTAQSMDINIVNKAFSINFDLTSSPELLQTRPGSTTDALQTIRSFMSPGNLMPKDLSEGTTSFEYLKVDSASLVNAISLSDANFVKINYFRKNYPISTQEKSDAPALTPNKKDGNVWFIISGEASRDKSIIGAEFHYFPIDEQRKSTYPLKTAQLAWNQLIAGLGVIVAPTVDNSTQVTIRKIYLAFFDSGKPQDFLQPIFVFEGDQGFVAYLPAVTGQYYNDPKFEEATPSATPK